MRRWRSGGRALCRCAARSGRTPAASAPSTPRRLPTSPPSHSRSRATRRSCTMRLLTLIVAPPVREWEEFFRTLRESRRATVLSAGGANFWVAAERLKSARLLYADSTIAPEIDDYDRTPTSDQESAATETLRGWLESSGPQTQSSLSQRYALSTGVMEAALLRLESEGQILRGRFTASATAQGSEIEWCNRRVLARIHRMTLGRLRREIEPVNARDFMRFLYHWQHVKPGTQLHGPDGALHVIKQLQGYEVSAAAWEGDVLRRRVGKYAPELLDQLCLSGRGRLGTVVAASRVRRSGAGEKRDCQARPSHAVGACIAVSARGCLVAARSGRLRSRGFPRASAGQGRVCSRPARGASARSRIVRRCAPGTRVTEPPGRLVSRRCRERDAPAHERRRRCVVGACCRGPRDR